MSMKTLLINPPYSYSEVPVMPMGLLYVAAVLEHNGHAVEIFDLLVSRCSKEKIRDKIEKYQPDIVGTTSVTLNFPGSSDILKSGIKSDQSQIEREKRRSPLEWAILQGDVIESLGMMKPEDDPVAGLVRKLAETVPYSHQEIKDKITKWIEDGLLKHNIKDGHLVWSWS